MKHTKGPWKVANYGPWVTDEDSEKVIFIGANTATGFNFAAGVASYEDLANRTLAAAAPEMFDFIDMMTHAMAIPESIRKIASNIIAKVEGGKP